AQESRLKDENYQTTTAPIVTRYPYFGADAFQTLALPAVKSARWRASTVHRAGFAAGFLGPHILIPQGVERSTGRVRAAYTEQDLVFQHSIQAIVFPESKKRIAKLLTAVLNSSLAAWVYFHDSANFGTERAKIHQSDLLRLPFDAPN